MRWGKAGSRPTQAAPASLHCSCSTRRSSAVKPAGSHPKVSGLSYLQREEKCTAEHADLA